MSLRQVISASKPFSFRKIAGNNEVNIDITRCIIILQS